MAKILNQQHLVQEDRLRKHSLLAKVHPQTDFKLYMQYHVVFANYSCIHELLLLTKLHPPIPTNQESSIPHH